MGARVEPIRDKKQINDILEALEADTSEIGQRRYLLFASGIWLGRRVGDLLKLRVGDVKDREILSVREEKTGKNIILMIPPRLRRIYHERLKGKADEDFLFQSHTRNRITGKPQAINKKTAYRDLKAIQRLGCFPEGYNLGTHTMRKTFGYWFYQTSHDTETLRRMFNHANEQVTRIYIGLMDDNIREAMKRVSTMYDE